MQQLKHNPPARTSSKDRTKATNLSGLRERRKPSRSMENSVIDGGLEMGDSPEDDASLLLQLRQATDEVESLRRDMSAVARERLTWQQRDDKLCLMLTKLGGRCEALEGSLKGESHAAYIEATRAKTAEDRFQKLLGWARKEEARRQRAEEELVRVSEEGRALEARVKVADEELNERKHQLDTRRFQLEKALDDLRRRTAENERLEEQAKLMQGELVALREVRDDRGSEVKELRERVTSLTKEAKSVSSENIKVRKQLCGERERWRATERSRAKQDKRRQIEIERKAEEMLALRYRVQELEGRLSSEVRWRRGAEEDARRSQQMERRSVEELMETRDNGRSHRPSRSSHFYTADQSAHEDYGGKLWQSWESGIDTAPAPPRSSAGPSWITTEPVTSHGGTGSTPYPLLSEEQSMKPRDSITPSPHPVHVPPRAVWMPSGSMSRRRDTLSVEGAAEHITAPQEPSSCPRQLSHSSEVLLFPRQERPRPRQPPIDDVDGVNKGCSGFEEKHHGRGSEERGGGRV